MIKFSLITVTFNAEKDFVSTAKSVLSQDYPYIEHIIIDGASKDNTVSLANKYKEESLQKNPIHEIVIISEPDKGIYDAMNKGLNLASGDYLCFLNAGDSLPNFSTLRMMTENIGLEKMKEENLLLPAVLYGNTDIVDEKGEYISKRRLQPPKDLSWRSFKYGMLVCHQAFYVKTNIAKKFPYNLDYKYSSDVDWCIRIMKEAEKESLKIMPVNMIIANYQREGISTKHHKDSLMERFSIMKMHYGICTTLYMHLWFVIRSFFK